MPCILKNAVRNIWYVLCFPFHTSRVFQLHFSIEHNAPPLITWWTQTNKRTIRRIYDNPTFPNWEARVHGLQESLLIPLRERELQFTIVCGSAPGRYWSYSGHCIGASFSYSRYASSLVKIKLLTMWRHHNSSVMNCLYCVLKTSFSFRFDSHAWGARIKLLENQLHWVCTHFCTDKFFSYCSGETKVRICFVKKAFHNPHNWEFSGKRILFLDQVSWLH